MTQHLLFTEGGEISDLSWWWKTQSSDDLKIHFPDAVGKDRHLTFSERSASKD